MSERVIYSGRLLKLVVRQVEQGSRTREREIVEHVPGAAVVAVDDDGQVLLVRQHRPAIGGELLELPAGLVDAGEEPIDCARRELQEETGFAADNVEPLLRFYPSPGFCTEVVHVFVGTNLRPADEHAIDEEEDVQVVRLTLEAALDQVLAGIADAKTVAGLLAYQQRRRGRARR